MSADDPSIQEEQVASLLAALDDALASEGPTPGSASAESAAALPPGLEQDFAYFRWLRQVLQPADGPADTAQQSTGRPLPETRDAPAEPGVPAADPSPPIGRFLIQRELGRGGFGVVFLAFDPRLGRAVALKVPRPEALVTPEYRQRFLREARAAAGLDHPNVVPVYEVGEAGPISYIAAAYCDGPTLAEWAARQDGPIPPTTAARLVAAMADGVEHAHRRGVLHRDLKPANVLLVSGELVSGEWSQDTTHHPKITDFGLAKFAPGGPLTEEAAGAGATVSGAILGTPAYMAPEQAAGRPGDVGPAADVYSLGAILYELLTGRPPFQGESALDTLSQVREREPVPPRWLRPSLRRDLETVCLKCLRKEPRRRYSSAGELAEDLRRHLRGEPVLARPVGAAEKAWRWCLRNPGVAVLAASLAFVVLASGAGLTGLWLRARASADRAEQERVRAERNLDEARRAVRRHFVELGQVRLNDPADPKELRRSQLEAALGYFRSFLDQRPDDPALQLEVAEAFYLVSQITHEIGSPEESRRANDEGRARLEALARDHPEVPEYRLYLAGSYHRLANLAVRTGGLSAARDLFAQGRQLLDGLLREDAENLRFRLNLAKLQIDLGVLHWESGDWKANRSELEQGRDALERLTREAPSVRAYQTDLALAYHNLGFNYRGAGAAVAAGAAFEKARALRAELVKANPNILEYQRDLGRTIFQLGFQQRGAGDAAGALACYEEARATQERLAHLNPAVGEYSYDLALTLINLGDAHRATGKPAEAVRLYEQGRDRFEALVQAHGSVMKYRDELAWAWQRLGSLQRVLKAYPAALHAFEQARSTQAELVREYPDRLSTHSEFGATCNNLGLTLLDLGRLDDALAAFQEAVTHQRRAFDRAPAIAQYRRYLSNHYLNMSLVQRQLGRPAAAAAAARERQPLWPDDPDALVSVATDLAQCAALAGRGKAELSAAEQAERQEYGDQAMAALRQAVARGFRDAAKLEAEPDLEPLRGRADFRQLITELKAGRAGAE